MKKAGLILALIVAVSGCARGERADIADAAPHVAFAEGISPRVQLNALRAERKLPLLQSSDALAKAARLHARDLWGNGFISHTGSDGAKIGARVTRAGFRWCTVAENIGQGTKYDTSTKVIEGWRGSPKHYRNIMNPKVKSFGMAKEGDVWVLVLAARKC